VAEADAFLTPHEARSAARGHRSATARLRAVRGRILAAGGDVDAAREAFEGALQGLGDLPMPYLRARINFAAGQTLRRAGKRREAEAALHRAREGYQGIGALAYADRCDRELKAGTRARVVPGGSGGNRATPAAIGLTPQEQAVVELVAGGLTNREAASHLFVSVKTVQYHLTRVYARLGVRSRSELAALVHRRRETG
jgi:DNA-binding CsgD family transcriptional regulator